MFMSDAGVWLEIMFISCGDLNFLLYMSVLYCECGGVSLFFFLCWLPERQVVSDSNMTSAPIFYIFLSPILPLCGSNALSNTEVTARTESKLCTAGMLLWKGHVKIRPA